MNVIEIQAKIKEYVEQREQKFQYDYQKRRKNMDAYFDRRRTSQFIHFNKNSKMLCASRPNDPRHTTDMKEVTCVLCRDILRGWGNDI